MRVRYTPWDCCERNTRGMECATRKRTIHWHARNEEHDEEQEHDKEPVPPWGTRRTTRNKENDEEQGVLRWTRGKSTSWREHDEEQGSSACDTCNEQSVVRKEPVPPWGTRRTTRDKENGEGQRVLRRKRGKLTNAVTPKRRRHEHQWRSLWRQWVWEQWTYLPDFRSDSGWSLTRAPHLPTVKSVDTPYRQKARCLWSDIRSGIVVCKPWGWGV